MFLRDRIPCGQIETFFNKTLKFAIFSRNFVKETKNYQLDLKKPKEAIALANRGVWRIYQQVSRSILYGIYIKHKY